MFTIACSRPPAATAEDEARRGACGSLDAESCFEELPLSPPVVHGQRVLVMTRTGFGARSNDRVDGYRQFVVVELSLTARRVVLVGDCPPESQPWLLGVTAAGAPTILCRTLIASLHVFGVSTERGVEWRWREARFEPNPGSLELSYAIPLADALVLLAHSPGRLGGRRPHWGFRIVPRSTPSTSLAGPEFTSLGEERGESPDQLAALVVGGPVLHVVLAGPFVPLVDVAISADGRVSAAPSAKEIDVDDDRYCVAARPDGSVFVSAADDPERYASLHFAGGAVPFGPDVVAPTAPCATAPTDPDLPGVAPEMRKDVRTVESKGGTLTVYRVQGVGAGPRSVELMGPEYGGKAYLGSFRVRRTHR